MGLDSTTLLVLAVAFCGWGLWWFLAKNDELPGALAAFNLGFVYRIITVQRNLLDWSNFDYGVDFSFSGYPNIAATYMLLGGVLITLTYCLRYSPPRVVADDERSLRDFILGHRKAIIALFALFFTANLVIRFAFQEDPQEITEQSYAYLFTLANSAFIILITALLLYSRGGSVIQKGLLLGVLAVVAYLTLAPYLRFAVLGWAIAVAIIVTRRFRPRRRLLALLGAALAVSVLFSALGAMRQIHDAPLGELIDRGVQNLTTSTDVNMVDGFVMLMQVYPDVLDYGLGTEHLEILTRPIPRAWWPEKPVGGWMQKLAAQTGHYSFNTGISPSLYGSFYGEGGVIGIIVFSVLYGIGFAKYVNWANCHGSALRWVLRGVLIAALFPLMRGGDIPGIAAFIGMSYWPLALFIWYYRRTLRRRERERRYRDEMVDRFARAGGAGGVLPRPRH